MRKVNIITDCTSDLIPELIEKYEIRVLPLYINFGDKSYRDGIDLSTEELYKMVDQYKTLPKSAALPPQVFRDTFAEYPDDEDIIFMGIGKKFSGTYQNAILASQDFTNVYVVDSANLSSGIGLLILKMCKFREEGLSAKEIVEKINVIAPKVRTQFSINTLTYLHMGGRCSGTSRIFGTMLKIKPIIKVVDGEMIVAKKPHGKYIKALDALLDYIYDDKVNLDMDYVMVTHSLADEDAIYLKKELREHIPGINILETRASGVISTHCGPRTIGISYIVDDESVK